MQIKLTKFSRTDGDKLLCKKIKLVEGELVKTASANMLTGTFETVSLDFHSDFGDFLKTMELNQALGMGVCQYCAEGEIVTRSSNKENVNQSKLCRTKDNFVWNKDHNLVFFDIDKNTADISEILADLFLVCPELSATDMWAYPSAGSCVGLDGEDPEKVKRIGEAISGWHIYFMIKGDVAAFQQWIEVKLWNQGKGWIEISKSGSMLKRCLVDLAVFSPERLDFIAGSHCGEGVVQDRGEPQLIDSGSREPLTGNWNIEQAEYSEYLSRVERAKFGKESESTKVKKDYAGELVATGKAPDIMSALKLIESANEDGELMGSWQIVLDNGDLISVATILDRPDQFDGMTCGDPLEPDYGGGRCKAKIFWNLRGANEVRITSFAHGGRQWLLKYDYKSLLDWIEDEGVTSETIIASWKHKMNSKNSVFSDEQRSDLLKKLKTKMGGVADVKTLRNTLQKAEIDSCTQQVDEKIAEFNETFAVLPIGNKVRILREFESPRSRRTENEEVVMKHDFTIITKQDFQLLKQNDNLEVGGKMRPSTDLWLTSKKRREFKGIEFNPAVIGDFDGFFNPFRGLAMEPKQGDWSLLKDHILKIICGDNDQYFEWLMAWAANCVQNPGNKAGTAVVMLGGQGTGKGTFATTLGKIFGQHFMPIASSKRLTGNFNFHLKDVILLFADEAYWGGNVAEEGALKQLITEDEIAIEAKGVDTFTVTNHVNLIMATNNDWAVPAQLDDRRFFVLEMDESKKDDKSYFKPIYDQLDNGGREAFMYDLLQLDISKVDIRRTPKTPALFKQKMHKMSYEESFLFHMLDDGDEEVWGNFVSTKYIYEKFLEYVSHSPAAPHRTENTFSRKFESIAETMTEKDRCYVNKKRVQGFHFAEVKIARQRFEKMVGQSVPWNFIDDPSEY